MSDYIKGSTRPHKAAEDEGISLANFGIPAASMDTWMHFQSKMQGDLTPCASRPEWTSNKAGDKARAIAGCNVCHAKAACHEYAESAQEQHGIWAGIDRSKK